MILNHKQLTVLERTPKRATFDANGRAEIVLEADGRQLQVHRIAVRTDSANPTLLQLYVDREDDGGFEDHSPAGNLDVAEFDFPLVVASSSRLILVWTGGAAGDRAYANVTYTAIAETARSC